MATKNITDEFADELSGPFDTYWQDEFFDYVVPDFNDLLKLKEAYFESDDEEEKLRINNLLLAAAVKKFMIIQEIRDLSNDEVDYLVEKWGEGHTLEDDDEDNDFF
jgi:hypothetical protein